MLRGQPPTIFGDGRQSRDFIYVENVVAANLLAVERPSELVAGRVFNVGCGKSVNLLELVAELNRLTGSSLEPQFQEPRAGDVRFSEADMSAARTDLGFNPAVSWATGIEKTLDFYRQTQIPTTS
jgi:UDP-glucose 4-epimerase